MIKVKLIAAMLLATLTMTEDIAINIKFDVIKRQMACDLVLKNVEIEGSSLESFDEFLKAQGLENAEEQELEDQTKLFTKRKEDEKNAKKLFVRLIKGDMTYDKVNLSQIIEDLKKKDEGSSQEDEDSDQEFEDSELEDEYWSLKDVDPGINDVFFVHRNYILEDDYKKYKKNKPFCNDECDLFNHKTDVKLVNSYVSQTGGKKELNCSFNVNSSLEKVMVGVVKRNNIYIISDHTSLEVDRKVKELLKDNTNPGSTDKSSVTETKSDKKALKPRLTKVVEYLQELTDTIPTEQKLVIV